MTIRQHFAVLFSLLWIGGCALALVYQTRLMLGMPLAADWLDAFVLGSTVFGYYCTHPLRPYRLLAWVLAGLAGISFLFLPVNIQLLALGPAILWTAYYGLQRPGRSGLRSRPILKPTVIALVWAWVTIWLPAQQWLWPMFAARTAFIFALALAYDLTDMDYDQRYQLVTLVNRVGRRQAFRIIHLVLLVAALCIGLGFLHQDFSLAVAGAIWATYLISALVLRPILDSGASISWQKMTIDALMALQAVLVWLALR